MSDATRLRVHVALHERTLRRIAENLRRVSPLRERDETLHANKYQHAVRKRSISD